jgi:hypothetical protein
MVKPGLMWRGRVISQALCKSAKCELKRCLGGDSLRLGKGKMLGKKSLEL